MLVLFLLAMGFFSVVDFTGDGLIRRKLEVHPFLAILKFGDYVITSKRDDIVILDNKVNTQFITCTFIIKFSPIGTAGGSSLFEILHKDYQNPLISMLRKKRNNS